MKEKISICLANKSQADVVKEIVDRTIREIYPKYYPQEVVQFFLDWHSLPHIEKDVAEGRVWLALQGEKIVGTGTIDGNTITRVYVLPECQGTGAGSAMMEHLEQEIFKTYDTVEIEASLPAVRFYNRRKYVPFEHMEHQAPNGKILPYDVMRKIRGEAAAVKPKVSLRTRTADSVRIYFEKAQDPEIKAVLPQKAQTVEEALADYEKTLEPDATSYGLTILVGGRYVVDIWCYGIDPSDEPNAMLSFCIFDKASWNQGIGTEAVAAFLQKATAQYGLRSIGAFTFSDNMASRRVLEKNGFRLMEEFEEDGRLSCYYQREAATYRDELISDFSSPLFQTAFQQYFAELDINVQDWEGLFREMNEEGGNEVSIRIAEDGQVIGFIMFTPIKCTSWFFEETCGFIREFWIAEEYRNQGHGASLLQMAEDRFKEQGICTSILTTDTAERFYLQHGYEPAPGCRAKNEDQVFVKRL